MEDEKFEVIGGSLEKSLNGQTKLNLKTHMEEAWELSKNGKAEILQGVMLLMFVFMLLFWVLQNYFDANDIAALPASFQITLKLGLIIITAPILAAMLLLGISQSVGVKPTFIPLLKQALGSVVIILLALLVSILVDLGSQILSMAGVALGIAASIYLGMGTGFSMMLLVEKKLAPSQTIIQSFRVFNRHWAPLSIFYLVSILMFVVGAFSFGVAYIWLIPFYFNLKGVLYRELFGVKVKKRQNTSSQNESIFHA